MVLGRVVRGLQGKGLGRLWCLEGYDGFLFRVSEARERTGTDSGNGFQGPWTTGKTLWLVEVTARRPAQA